MALRWDSSYLQGAVVARSGSIIIGMLVPLPDGRVAWSIQDIRLPRPQHVRGKSDSMAKAKRAISRRWREWLDAAGLAPVRGSA